MPTPVSVPLVQWISNVIGNLRPSTPATAPTPAFAAWSPGPTPGAIAEYERQRATGMPTPTVTTTRGAGLNTRERAYRSEAKHGLPPEIYGSVPPSAGPEPTMDDLLALLGMAGLSGGGGGGGDALGWAQLDLEREQMAQQAQQFAQSLAQAAEIEAQRRAQQQREMAAAMGQAIASLQSQQWETGLPWRLPTGTQYAPGMEPGGPASRLAQMARAAYTAPRIVPSNPPSRSEMESWLAAALKRFGPQ